MSDMSNMWTQTVVVKVPDGCGNMVKKEVLVWRLVASSSVFSDMLACCLTGDQPQELELPDVTEAIFDLYWRYETNADFVAGTSVQDITKLLAAISFAHKYDCVKVLKYFSTLPLEVPVKQISSDNLRAMFLLGASLEIPSLATYALTGGFEIGESSRSGKTFTRTLQPHLLRYNEWSQMSKKYSFAFTRAFETSNGQIRQVPGSPEAWREVASAFADELRNLAH